MTKISSAIIAPLIYYDLLDKPLTPLEVFQYLRATAPEVSFFNVWQELRVAARQINQLAQKNGLYFLPGRQKLLASRAERLKLAQQKWKNLKKFSRYLALAPFLRLVAATGSLTSYNTQPQSDFDLLIVIKKNRLWLGRLLLTGLVALLGKRRHGRMTKDRICLNCYLTEECLEITCQAKPRDFHAAQEYTRLTPLLENSPRTHEKFIEANSWLKYFLKNPSWANGQNAKRVLAPAIFVWARRASEYLLAGPIGDWLEKIAGQWQTKRIREKNTGAKLREADQIFVSDFCLMFHPQSKSDKLMKEFSAKWEN